MAYEYVLKSDGRVLRRPFEVQAAGELEINVDEALLSTLNTKVVRRQRGAFSVPAGPAGVCQTDETGTCYVSTRLPFLPIATTVRPEQKLIVPTWQKTGDIVSLEWTPPENMTLVFTGHCYLISPHPYAPAWECDVVYLFAFNGDGKQCFKLPMPNLYDDCHICTGRKDNPYHGQTIQEVFGNALADFAASKWNADLINDGERKNSDLLFRFHPKKTGFDVLPPVQDWKTLCAKVGTGVLEYVVL